MAEPVSEYRLHIHGYTPDTIPMKRLAEYMSDLANLLGHPQSVHFVRVDPTSLSLVHKVDTEDIPKVRERLYVVAKDPSNAPSDAMAAYHAINARLESDNATAEIFADDNVIEFPGKTAPAPEPVRIGPIIQRDTIVGIPIMIGGKRDFVPVHIETGNGTVPCRAKRSVARRLGRYLFEDVIKAVGEAKWIRTEEHGWTLEDFVIDDFDPTDDHDLNETLESIRQATRGHWSTDDPAREILRLRRDD
jgi:hypothetical protein